MKELLKIMDSFIEECDLHKSKIEFTQKKLSGFIPLDSFKLKEIENEYSSVIDQLIYRFSKLQDSLGEKVMPMYLKLGGEDSKNKIFIEVLNRMEQLEIVTKQEWMYLREVRNAIFHEYILNKDDLAKIINEVYNSSQKLIEIYVKFKIKIIQNFYSSGTI